MLYRPASTPHMSWWREAWGLGLAALLLHGPGLCGCLYPISWVCEWIAPLEALVSGRGGALGLGSLGLDLSLLWHSQLSAEHAGSSPRPPGTSALWLLGEPPLQGSSLGRGYHCPCSGPLGALMLWRAYGCLGPGAPPCLLLVLQGDLTAQRVSVSLIQTGSWSIVQGSDS